jgi:hypothetical protein
LEDSLMRVSNKLSTAMRHTLTHILIAVSIAIPISQSSLASERTHGAMVLVLDNSDSDNRDTTPPFGDAVSLLNSRGELVRMVTRGLMTGPNWGGCRAISASQDGRFFVVCENAADRLTVCETSTGRTLWSLLGKFESAVFANGLVYALNRESVFAIDSTGTIVKHAKVGGIDIVVDPSGHCLWIVGLDIRKCNLDLQLMVTVDAIKGKGGAFSVDVSPDGSIWVGAQHMPEIDRGENRLLKISPEGSVLKTIDLDFSPVCVRVDRSNGGVWVAGSGPLDFSKVGDEWPETLAKLYEQAEGKTRTCKYDSEGKLAVEISKGGHSIDVDPSDGSVWIAGRKQIWHYSSTGTNLATYADVSDCQKWLAVLHGQKAGN